MTNDRRTNKGRTNKGHRKTSLTTYIPLTLLQGFERVVHGLHVRGCWRPNINFIFWPPLLMTVTLWLSCSLRCSTRGFRVHCWMLAFFTASYQHLLWTPVHQGFKPHRPDVAFLTTSRLSLEVCWQLLWHPTQLNYIIIQRPHDHPLDLWNRMFNRHQAEITVMQFRGYFFRCITVVALWDLHLVPYHKP